MGKKVIFGGATEFDVIERRLTRLTNVKKELLKASKEVPRFSHARVIFEVHKDRDGKTFVTHFETRIYL